MRHYRVATIAEQPFTVANIPVSSWSRAIRIWLATILAWFVCFWLQLEAPTTPRLPLEFLPNRPGVKRWTRQVFDCSPTSWA